MSDKGHVGIGNAHKEIGRYNASKLHQNVLKMHIGGSNKPKCAIVVRLCATAIHAVHDPAG